MQKMIIKFTKDLGKYQAGKVHVCKSDLDVAKAKELIKWGFAQEITEREAAQMFRESSSSATKETEMAVARLRKTEPEPAAIKPAVLKVQEEPKKMIEDQDQLLELAQDKEALKKKVRNLRQERKGLMDLLQNNLEVLKGEVETKDKRIAELDKDFEAWSEVEEGLGRLSVFLNEELTAKDRKQKKQEEEIIFYKEQAASLKTKIEAKDEQIQKLNERGEVLANDLKEERDRRREAAKRNSELKEREADLLEQKNELEQKLTEQVKELEEDKATKEEQLDVLTKELKGLQILERYEGKQREKEKKEREEEIEELRRRVEETEEERSRALLLFKENLEILEDQLARKDEQIASQDKQLEKMSEENRFLKKQETIVLNELDKMQTERNERKKAWEKDFTSLKKAQDSKVVNLEEEITGLRREIASKDRQIEALNQGMKEFLERGQLFEDDENGNGNGNGEGLTASEEIIKRLAGGEVIDED